MTLKEYLILYNKFPNPNDNSEYHTHYEGEEEDYKAIQEYNKELIRKYPWVEPCNVWSGKRISDCSGSDGEEGFWPGNPTDHPDYDYTYTELDHLPDGWRLAFGEQLCEELNTALNKTNFADDYRITEIKEKWGGLRWYDNGSTTEMQDIIDKYESLSFRTCINCGKPAKWVTRGWISPYCDSCKTELENSKHFYDNFSPLLDKEDSM